MSPRPARQGDLDLAAGWLGLEEAPASWTSDLELGASFALEPSGEPVAVCLLRPWGRVLVAPLFVVEPGRRGRGHGRALTAAAREEALRREALSVGLEAEAADGASLLALVRCGFKVASPVFALDWSLPSPPPEAEAEPDPEAEAEANGDGASEAAAPMSPAPADRAAPEPSLDEIAQLASSLDHAFEPVTWAELRRRSGARWVGVWDETGGLLAAALAEPAAGEEASLPCPLVLIGEGEPFACLGPLARELAVGGVRSARLVVSGRQADALRALSRTGATVVGLRLRLHLEGFPERGDLRRAVLASWR